MVSFMITCDDVDVRCIDLLGAMHGNQSRRTKESCDEEEKAVPQSSSRVGEQGSAEDNPQTEELFLISKQG